MDDPETFTRSFSLNSLLQAREKRAARQDKWLTRYHQPVISLTLVTPGPVKTSARYENIMGVALQVCDQWISQNHWPLTARQVSWLATGPEALWCVDHPAAELKKQLAEIEQTHPLGRLWDFDVICPVSGVTDRKSMNHPARRCLVCDLPAISCARSRRHPPQVVLDCVEKIINDWFTRG